MFNFKTTIKSKTIKIDGVEQTTTKSETAFKKMDEAFEKMDEAFKEMGDLSEYQEIEQDGLKVTLKEGKIIIEGKPKSVTLNGKELIL